MLNDTKSKMEKIGNTSLHIVCDVTMNKLHKKFFKKIVDFLGL